MIAILSIVALLVATVDPHSSRRSPVTLGVTLAPTVVVGGNPTVAVVTLTAPAPIGGLPVTVATSSIGVAALVSPQLGPLSSVSTLAITIPAGARSASVALQTFGVVSPMTVTIRASDATETATANLTVNAATLRAFTISPSGVAGGQSTIGTITLDGKAPASGGTNVSLATSFASTSGTTLADGSVRTVSPSAAGAAAVPTVVNVRGGATGASFTVTTVPVAAATTATVLASLGTTSLSATLRIAAPAPTAVQLNPPTVVGGAGSTGTVIMSGAAAAGGQTVVLSASSPDASVPRVVTVPGGVDRANFSIATNAVTNSRSVVIAARSVATTSSPAIADGSSNTISLGESTTGPSATLTIVPPPQLQSIAVQPATVVAGAPITISVAFTTSASASTSAITAQLTSDHPDVVQVPASLALASSATSLTAGSPVATVTAATLLPAVDQTITVSASLGSQRVTTTVTVIRPIAAFTVGPNPVVGGSALIGTLRLATAVTTAQVVSFSTDHPEIVQVTPTATAIPGGSATRVPFRTSAVTADTPVTITAKIGAQQVSVPITISPQR